MFEGSGSISIENGAKCLEEVSSKGATVLAFRSCWSHVLAQNFSLVPEGCLIKNIKTGHCLAASKTTSNSGVWRSRVLEVVDCGSVDKKLLSWSIYPRDPRNKLDCENPRRDPDLQNWAVVLLTIFVIAIFIAALWLYKLWRDRQNGYSSSAPLPTKVELKFLQCPAGHKLKDSVAVVTERRWCDFCDNTRFYEGTRVHTCVECNWIVCTRCYNRRSRPCSNPSAVLLVTSPGRNAELLTTANMIASPKPRPVKRDLRTRIHSKINRVTRQYSSPPSYPSEKEKTALRAERIGKEIDQIRVVVNEITNLQRHYRDYRTRSSSSTSLSPSRSCSITPRRTRAGRRERWSRDRY